MIKLNYGTDLERISTSIPQACTAQETFQEDCSSKLVISIASENTTVQVGVLMARVDYLPTIP